jgi:hypothetical protein
MKTVLLSLFVSISANAQEYKQFYLVNNTQVSAETAILASMKGQSAFKCSAVEYKVSKAGTSIGIRAIKKPKAGSQ